MKRPLSFCLGLLLIGAVRCFAQSDSTDALRSPFGIRIDTATLESEPALRVRFSVPADCVLYAERLHFLQADGTELAPKKIPVPQVLMDKASGHEKRIYDRDFEAWLAPVAGNLSIKFQGCTNAACFFPEKRTFAPAADGAYTELTATTPELVAMTPDAASASSDWETPAKEFQVIARQTGYVKAGDFVSFLNKAISGEVQTANDPLAKYKRFGLLATVFLILLGGLGLNLTPCVLPLIPINLAIIGAGRAAHSRAEGFLHGAAYGIGMSLAYGVLGLAVVLTGAKFGTLNSSIWFNVAIALIFAVLGLAMFDLFHIDFTRFDRSLGKQESHLAHKTRSKWFVAFTLGVVAALLAGACVAPVVISVLLMATDLHAKGSAIGLALPFLLGVGMALPWPFMGASLSFLPKPGKWMVGVKYSFGVAIILFACYYAHIAYGLFQSRQAQTSLAAAPLGTKLIAGGDQTLAVALEKARASGRAVFVDFAASWCKNCEAMDLTVFNQTNVQKRLANFIVVRYQAERPNESPAREVLDHFKVIGLPTYLVLSPKK